MITQKDVAQYMDILFDDCRDLREAGQKEYAHDERNAMANFEDVAQLLGISREKVLFTYLMKHIRGIAAYINGHESQREDILGRVKDSVVYHGLLYSMIQDNRSKPVATQESDMAMSPVADVEKELRNSVKTYEAQLKHAQQRLNEFLKHRASKEPQYDPRVSLL